MNLLEAIPGVTWLSEKYTRLWHTIVPWVAIHLFHLSGPVTVYPDVNGSGDTTLDYIEDLCLVATAVLATLIWSLLDFKRTEYQRVDFYLRVYVRYALSFTLFGYGFAKVFPTQFIFPGFSRLIEPLGDFSPMGLLWTFMGYSTAYIIFSGLAEVSGSILLLFRRTATLGAMASAAVLLNVVTLNFCYDVPVKLYSLNLLLMAIFLMVPDVPRLAMQWKRVAIQSPAAFTVRTLDGSAHVYSTEYNQAKNSVTVSGDPDKSKKTVFTYSRPDPDHLVLEGALTIELKRMNRGFHWINERPFNK